jgi:hypothetical protein
VVSLLATIAGTPPALACQSSAIQLKSTHCEVSIRIEDSKSFAVGLKTNKARCHLSQADVTAILGLVEHGFRVVEAFSPARAAALAKKQGEACAAQHFERSGAWLGIGADESGTPDPTGACRYPPIPAC